MSRQPTLRDVAEKAGVAVSTASRALTRPGRISAHTTERVRAAADALGYTPSASARALSSGRTTTVALVVPDVTNPFYFGLVRGTGARLREGGYVQVLVDTEESAEAEARALVGLRGTVDGAVLAASRLADARLAELAADLPIVAVNRTSPSLAAPSVLIDTPSGLVQALEHLASLGHRRIAYASGPRTSWSDSRRQAALHPAAARLGLDVTVLGPYAPVRTAGPAAADAAVQADVTAVVAFNDLLAFGILERLDARGVVVPDRMSVVGCDDVFGADLVRPALTTVASPMERAGRLAADLLISRLEGTGPYPGYATEPAVLPTHLVIRSSTGTAPSA